MTAMANVDLERQVESLPTQKALWAYLEQCAGELVSVTEKMALAVAKSQREGWELPPFLSKSRIAWLMRIANKQVDPKLYDGLCGYTKALRMFGGLPIQEQRQIAAEGAVELVEAGGDKRRVELLALEDRDLKQLFDRDGSLRSIGAQKHYLSSLADEPRKVRAEEDVVKIEIDKRSQSLSVRFMDRVVKIPKKDLARYLEQLI